MIFAKPVSSGFMNCIPHIVVLWLFHLLIMISLVFYVRVMAPKFSWKPFLLLRRRLLLLKTWRLILQRRTRKRIKTRMEEAIQNHKPNRSRKYKLRPRRTRMRRRIQPPNQLLPPPSQQQQQQHHHHHHRHRNFTYFWFVFISSFFSLLPFLRSGFLVQNSSFFSS